MKNKLKFTADMVTAELTKMRTENEALREANRGLVEALNDVEETLIGHGWDRLLDRIKTTLANHGGSHE